MYYKNNDTGMIWSRDEIRQEYENLPEVQEQYPDFDGYMDYLLDLGKHYGEGLRELESEDLERYEEFMDDDIRQQVIASSPKNASEFLEKYLELDPKFEEVIE